MMVKGRTVVILLIVSIVTTSFLTFFFVDGFGNVVNGIDKLLTAGKGEITHTSTDSPEIKRFVEAFNEIESNYVVKKTDDELINGAITGMVESLDDPHSSYMDAEQAKDFFGSLSDSFEGIGAEVSMENGKVTVIAPIKDSPAEKAGIQPQDQIISVNGDSLEGLNLFDAVKKIRGPKGSKAVLSVLRPGLTEALTITVVRDEIPLETVSYETLNTEKGKVGKIQITDFGENTADDFKSALKDLEKKGIKGLIIDLRGNPGGYLTSVLEIGNLVIPNKGIIVQIEDRDGNKKAYRSSLGKAKYPIVGLIDKGSASASEILASSLKEAGHYPLVGETSYGKGTVQNPFELSDGSNLKITIAKWLTSDGNWIHKKGIEPNVKVDEPNYYYALPFPENVNLQYDMNNNQVKNLQIIMNGLGYGTDRTDGYFDLDTKAAVKAFQLKNHLEANGVVDSKTGMMLQKQIIGKIRDPKTDKQLQKGIESLVNLIK